MANGSRHLEHGFGLIKFWLIKKRHYTKVRANISNHNVVMITWSYIKPSNIYNKNYTNEYSKQANDQYML